MSFDKHPTEITPLKKVYFKRGRAHDPKPEGHLRYSLRGFQPGLNNVSDSLMPVIRHQALGIRDWGLENGMT